MESNLELFFKHQAQTTLHPLAIEISFAKGSYIYDINGKKYLDFVAGVSANTLGHNHPKVNEAVKNQVDKYMHVMVYGEFIQEPQVALATLLRGLHRPKRPAHQEHIPSKKPPDPS